MSACLNRDWQCMNCQAQNDATYVFCSQCFIAKGVAASRLVPIDNKIIQQPQYTGTNRQNSNPSRPATQVIVFVSCDHSS